MDIAYYFNALSGVYTSLTSTTVSLNSHQPPPPLSPPPPPFLFFCLFIYLFNTSDQNVISSTHCKCSTFLRFVLPPAILKNLSCCWIMPHDDVWIIDYLMLNRGTEKAFLSYSRSSVAFWDALHVCPPEQFIWSLSYSAQLIRAPCTCLSHMCTPPGVCIKCVSAPIHGYVCMNILKNFLAHCLRKSGAE